MSALDNQITLIVDHLYELADVPIDKLQEINDKADEYLKAQFAKLFTEHGIELLKRYDNETYNQSENWQMKYYEMARAYHTVAAERDTLLKKEMQ